MPAVLAGIGSVLGALGFNAISEFSRVLGAVLAARLHFSVPEECRDWLLGEALVEEALCVVVGRAHGSKNVEFNRERPSDFPVL